jgi:hypothetical protein
MGKKQNGMDRHYWRDASHQGQGRRLIPGDGIIRLHRGRSLGICGNAQRQWT